jgi:hypothetical protein
VPLGIKSIALIRNQAANGQLTGPASLLLSREAEVLSTGPGILPPVLVLTDCSVRLGLLPGQTHNRVGLMGLLPGPGIKPQFLGRVVPGLQVHFTVPPYSSKFPPN